MTVSARASSVLRLLRWGWFRAAVAVLALGAACSTQAQSQPQRSAKTAPATQASERAAEAPAPSTGKGLHTGITVHGHWTIEVKSPDGKVVTHREFENSLSGGGAESLTNLLSRQSITGAWGVELSQGGGACPPGSCMLVEPNSTWTLPDYPNLGTPCKDQGPACFPSLSVLPPGSNNTVNLSGSFVAPNAGGVSQVISWVFVCQFAVNGVPVSNPPTSPSACASMSEASVNGNVQALTQLGFTSASFSSPVTWSSGQSVSVSVTFSFQ